VASSCEVITHVHSATRLGEKFVVTCPRNPESEVVRNTLNLSAKHLSIFIPTLICTVGGPAWAYSVSNRCLERRGLCNRKWA